MTRTLSREGARPWVSGFFFKSVVQSVLLFGAETLIFSPHMGRFLGGFQDRVERQLTRRISHQRLDGKWEYTLVEAEIAEAGFEMM